ncbi:hypothetical protein FOZ60_001012 [Perkinsus olseni]|uniref:Diacylglycerol kinase n=1 Tax=Perkinsus olseni TaxID=32597 RepID=A0A7J6P2B0_PEROL|nr:hypothetical protein FOZ60_001012 [Perkinsus olseni]
MVSTPEASPTMVSSSSLLVHQQQSSRSPMVYIFINPTSGSNRASEYLTLGLQHMSFRDNNCDVYIFDISDGASGCKPAFVRLAAHGNNRDASHPIRVLVAGGDGTIMWFLDEAIKHSVDIDSIAIGVIPFGTANDFSRTLGWGAQAPRVLLGKRLSNLKDMLTEWLHASIVPFDIWEVEISCTASGSIQQVKNSVKTPLRNEDGEILRHLMKPICNYFSVGVESRVGLGFDKHRTKSQLLNKAVYVVEGTKKITFTHTPRISHLLNCATTTTDSGKDHIIFTTDPTEETCCLTGSPVSIVMLNIPSIMGGCDVWSKAKRVGVECGINSHGRSSPDPDILGKLQDPGDGKFELMSYDTLFGLSAEQLRIAPFAGNGQRLYQGGGPVVLHFKSLDDSIRTYFQIDGEYFMCKHPDTITIRHQRKIHVLRR